MSSGLSSGVSGLALGTGLYANVSGLWSGASGFVTGDGASLSLNFLAGAPLDSRITFTRGSTATFVGSNGLIQSAAINAPRFDYDPVTLAPKGLLIEEQRTNYALYGSDLTNAAWAATNCTTAKTATGPDGVSNSATTVTATAGNATILQAITDASNARITSCYIKRRTGTGVVNMTQDNGATWAAVTVTASWTRVSIASATLANPTIGLRLVTSGDAVDVWGFQNERGAFVTSVIPTVASTATRSADVATMTGANFSSWYRQDEGAWAVEWAAANGNFVVAQISGSTSDNRFLMLSSSADQISVTTATVSQGVIDAGTINAGAVNKLAYAYRTNDTAASLNNGAAVADNTVTLPTVDRLCLGATVSPGSFLNGHIRTLAYYNTRLPNSTLVSLTS